METKLDGLISSFNCMTQGQAETEKAIDNITARLVRVEIEAGVVRWVGSVVVLYLLIPILKKVLGI